MNPKKDFLQINRFVAIDFIGLLTYSDSVYFMLVVEIVVFIYF